MLGDTEKGLSSWNCQELKSRRKCLLKYAPSANIPDWLCQLGIVGGEGRLVVGSDVGCIYFSFYFTKFLHFFILTVSP